MQKKEKWAMNHVEAQIRPGATDLVKIYAQTDFIAGFELAKHKCLEELMCGTFETLTGRIQRLGESEK